MIVKVLSRVVCSLGLAALVAGCQTAQTPDSEVLDSGPDQIPRGLLTQPDPEPRDEPLSASGNSASYVVYGQRYYRLPTARGFDKQGIASWYGRKFHGRLTASGEPYDMYGMTAAHKSLPLPTYARVTNLENNRSVTVRINDRGPFVDDRLIDLSYAAAAKLGMLENGTAPVRVVTLSGVPGEPATPSTGVASSSPGAAGASGNQGAGSVAVKPLPYVVPQPIYDPQGEEPEPIQLAIAEQSSGYGEALYLQLGAFGSFEAAGALRSRVDPSLAAPVFVAKQSGEALFKVQAGPFTTSQALDAARLVLQERHSLDPIVFVQNSPEPNCC